MEQCAPTKQYENGSCFTLESIILITNAYNNNHSDKIPLVYDKKFLVKELYIRIREKYNCKNQLCWLNQDFIKSLKNDEILNNTFRPTGPRHNLKWLNTLHINKTLLQYCKKHPEFQFFGAVPIDFDKFKHFGIKNIDFNQYLQQNIHKFGFVFNLDEHWQSGSHWVALYADIKENKIYFFDSTSNPPDERIQVLINRIHDFCKKKSEPATDIIVEYNKIKHQFKNTECGVYSMNFILRLLKGETFDEITRNITPDDKMAECRKYYFNTESASAST
jgi:hypothetical protein